jgi:hypothetical protein
MSSTRVPDAEREGRVPGAGVRKAAPGVDGSLGRSMRLDLEDRLADLHGRVHRRAYRALPSRRVYIQKKDGRQRPLGVPGPGVPPDCGA